MLWYKVWFVGLKCLLVEFTLCLHPSAFITIIIIFSLSSELSPCLFFLTHSAMAYICLTVCGALLSRYHAELLMTMSLPPRLGDTAVLLWLESDTTCYPLSLSPSMSLCIFHSLSFSLTLCLSLSSSLSLLSFSTHTIEVTSVFSKSRSVFNDLSFLAPVRASQGDRVKLKSWNTLQYVR